MRHAVQERPCARKPTARSKRADYPARMQLDAPALVRTLDLKPHPEGGFYTETFRSSLTLESAAHTGSRAASTAIYFLLRSEDFSAFHRVRSDEVWHHYLGDPLELLLLDGEAKLSRQLLGSDLTNGQRPQAVVARNVLQAARVAPGTARHGFSLCGCTVAPGFDFADFELPTRATLRSQYPQHAALIDTFTR
jgi:uncharacterized protein